jgi:hypothetical protein
MFILVPSSARTSFSPFTPREDGHFLIEAGHSLAGNTMDRRTSWAKNTCSGESNASIVLISAAVLPQKVYHGYQFLIAIHDSPSSDQTMLLFFSFPFQFSTSTLKHGEDPYKILGVSRHATQDEIRRAFMDITRKHHPDRAKNKESERIWMRANDAYELLKDEKRRHAFDRTGSVGEEPGSGGYHEYNTGDPFSFFHNFDSSWDYKFRTEQVGFEEHRQILKITKEMFILIYQEHDPFSAMQCGPMFDGLADELKESTKFMRAPVVTRAGFISEYDIRRIPAILYLREEQDGTVTHEISTSVNSRETILDWIQSVWNADIAYFTRVERLKQWIQKVQGFTRVVAIEYGNDPSMAFKKMAAMYRHVKFAVLIDDYVAAIREFKLKTFPATIVFRGSRQVDFTTIEDVANPLFARLERDSLATVCYERCFVHIGPPTDDLLTSLVNFTEVPVMWIPGKSHFAHALGVGEEQWVILSGRTSQFAEVNITQKYEAIKKFRQQSQKARQIPVEPDWTLASRFKAGKKVAKSWAKKMNPLRLLKSISWDGLQFMSLPLIMLLAFIVPSFLRLHA